MTPDKWSGFEQDSLTLAYNAGYNNGKKVEKLASEIVDEMIAHRDKQIAARPEGFYGLPQGRVSSSNAGGKCVTVGETTPNEMQNTQRGTTMITKLKSALTRLFGAKPVDKPAAPETTAPEIIWSKEWCAKESELAAKAIETLQMMVKDNQETRSSALPAGMAFNSIANKPKKERRFSVNPKAVYLSEVPPRTIFKLLRDGKRYYTHTDYQSQFNLHTNEKAHLHGNCRVVVLPNKPL